jgi:cytochrome P450
VIGELLGVPADERERFRGRSDALLSLPRAGADPGAGWAQLSGQVTELIARKRQHPSDDLLSALIAVRDADADRLSEPELQMMAITLIMAGYVTTSVAIGLGVILLSGRGQLARLAAEPALVPTAVEEVLRFQAAGGDVARVATEDLELHGVRIHAGDKVVVSTTAANRDERHFADPDRFDIARVENPHLTFGHGIHHCLGAALARQELQVVFTTLAVRLPGLNLAVPAEELRWRRSELFGDEWPQAVPVSW